MSQEEIDDYLENNFDPSNSARPDAWLALGYPVRNGDYYFALIGDRKGKNIKDNQRMNDQLKKMKKLYDDPDALYDNFMDWSYDNIKNAGVGDTMVREEVWAACLHIMRMRVATVYVKEELDNLDEGFFKRLFKKLKRRGVRLLRPKAVPKESVKEAMTKAQKAKRYEMIKKAVEKINARNLKRAKADAAADTAIEFGRKLRTGEASLKDPSSAIDVASEQFSKPAELQQKVDLALIENELKKQQIAAQAKATTERALDIEKRKREITTMGDLVRADKSGQGLTHVGTLGIAREFADLTGKKFRGSIGNDEKLAEFEKNERFKIDELGIITEQLLQGDDGLYILGTRVYEKTGPIVKLIKT